MSETRRTTVGELTAADLGSVVAIPAGPCVTYRGPLLVVRAITEGMCSGEIGLTVDERPRGGLRQRLNFPPHTPCTVLSPSPIVGSGGMWHDQCPACFWLRTPMSPYHVCAHGGPDFPPLMDAESLAAVDEVPARVAEFEAHRG